MIGQRTFVATRANTDKQWYLVDAGGKTLGRLASEIARRLRGKHKPQFTPGVDCGDYIIVTNTDQLSVTGNKAEGKKYYRYTGYVGNLKESNFERMMEKDSTQVLRLAVKGMLPRGSLGRQQLRNLKIYASSEHPHASQEPVCLDINI